MYFNQLETPVVSSLERNDSEVMASPTKDRVAVLAGAGTSPWVVCEGTESNLTIATGMGNGVAIDLAKKGWKVVILDYNAEEGSKVAEAIGGDFHQTDTRFWPQQFAAFDETFKKYGRIDFGM
jgi:NAD(P)-dependent dehydrogenase (short-subunit alcohol dehydrogenase family)